MNLVDISNRFLLSARYYLIKFEFYRRLEKSRDILKQFWGYDAFRPLQEEIVDSVIYGHDTLAILPTGGGKSICFQVPGLALDGLTIVISPLIALMEDQVKNLRSRGIEAGLITSAMSYREIDITLDNARFGRTKFLYTSPERLKSDLFIERFKLMNISLIVVDEAHCISEWGHDFRPSYTEIAETRKIHPNAPIIALTASATKHVQEDIIVKLELKNVQEFAGSLERKNVHYNVVPAENKLKQVIDFCQRHNGVTGIVYCQTRKSVKAIAQQLRAHKLSAGIYHGGLNAEDRKYMLEHWMNDQLKIMVATNAFGMGIDKPDVRYVVHYEIPNNLEAYYQEAGRAGRDGNSATAIAFWEQKDLEIMKDQLEAKYPPIEKVKLVYNSVCNYLKVAIGSGAQETYNFDIVHFSKTFNISVSEVFYALKILQLNENLHFTEKSFHPTRLKFAIGSSALYKFQVAHTPHNDLITLLTRSYPGIFDRFIRIDETEIAKRLKLTKEALTEQLKEIEKYGVIDVQFQTNLPQITFLQERLPENYLTIHNDIYHQRKQVETDKLSGMIDYISSNKCRSEMIGVYFDSNVSKCGTCDVCKSELASNHTFEELLTIIPTILPNSAEKISLQLSIDRNLTQRALHKLLLEEKIRLSEGEFIAF